MCTRKSFRTLHNGAVHILCRIDISNMNILLSHMRVRTRSANRLPSDQDPDTTAPALTTALAVSGQKFSSPITSARPYFLSARIGASFA